MNYDSTDTDAFFGLRITLIFYSFILYFWITERSHPKPMKNPLIQKSPSLINLIVLFFWGVNSFAQVDSVKLSYLEMPLEDLIKMEVTSVSGNLEHSNEAPATIYVINEEQITIRGYNSLEEVLEDIPEIEIQKKSSVEYSNYFTIRGIDGSEKFIIMMDGMRINSPTGTPLPIVHNYPVADAKQIEVILGPASALYGVDAFTGVINIITKKGFEAKTLKLNSSVGMYNTSNTNIVLGLGNRDVSFQLSGSFYYSKEPYFPDLFKEDYSWFHERYKTNGEVLLSPFSSEVLTVPIEDYESPTMSYAIHSKLNLKDFEIGYFRNYESHNSSISSKPEYSVYSKETSFKESVESLYAKHNFKSKNEKYYLESTISHSKDEIDPKSLYINTYTSYDKGYKYGYNKAFKIEEQLKISFSEKSLLTVGFSFEDIDALPKSGDLPFSFNKNSAANLQNLYYLGTNVTDSAGNDLTIEQDFYYIQYQNLGTFIQFQTHISNSFILTLGGRFDFNTRYGNTVNPRLGLVYKPLNKLNIRLLYGRAYLQPSPYRTYQHYGSFVPVIDSASGAVTGLTANFWRLPDAELKPQTVNTTELIVSYLITSNMAFSINGFYNYVNDIISSQGYTGETFHGIPVTYIERPINKGEATTYGGTVFLSYKLHLSKYKLNSYLAYSYIDGEIDGKPIPFSAKNTIKGGLDIRLKNISLSPRFIYRSESKHRSLTDENGERLTNDPFTLVNLMAKYDISAFEKMNLSFYLKINNLLNRKYYNLPIGGSESLAGSPQDPIRINVGLEIQF